MAAKSVGHFVFVVTAFSLSAIYLETPALTESIVHTEQGALRGSTKDEVTAFKGIPFAEPPVGSLRWRAPQPPIKWQGVRDATQFGPQCIQIDFMGKRVQNQSEDCLTLNVWKPAGAKAGDLLPVLVWSYGGAFIIGGNSVEAYDGKRYAERGVIMVSLNYRLGRLGFFAHPALLRGEDNEPVGNYAVMDVLAALKWVKENIQHFGGNSGNVTVFGQSAGGMMVNMLMTSPAASGLFNSAVSLSGAFETQMTPLRGATGSAEADGLAFARANGIHGDGPEALAALRALPATLIAGQDQLPVPRSGLGPILDGTIVKEEPRSAFANNRQARVPYVAGATSWEASLTPTAKPQEIFASLNKGGAEVESLYVREFVDHQKASQFALTDSMSTVPVRELVSRHASHGLPAYAYYFSYLPHAQRSEFSGVPHGGELLYLFGNLRDEPFAFYDLFASNGVPGKAGGIEWPAYAPGETFLEFGPDQPQASGHFRKEMLDAVSKVPPMPLKVPGSG